MNVLSFRTLLEKTGHRHHVVGDESFGILATLDLEGRLFTLLDGDVVSRVNPSALSDPPTRETYRSPGGDTLWPAPEGTTLGYFYPAGRWRAPPGLTGARYRIVEASPAAAKMEAEVDLINNIGLGLPCLFERRVVLDRETGEPIVETEDSIRYLGARELDRSRFRLAPWSLSQFDSAPDAEARFPDRPDSVRDLYESSETLRESRGGMCRFRMNGTRRHQIALSEDIEFIEYHNPARGLVAHRAAHTTGPGRYADIADAPPDIAPSEFGTRFSLYSDPSGFMEMEAVGGCPEVLRNGDRLSVLIRTRYSRRRGENQTRNKGL